MVPVNAQTDIFTSTKQVHSCTCKLRR